MIPITERLICPECQAPLEKTDAGHLLCAQGHHFAIRAGVYDLLPAHMHATTEADAIYHEQVKEEWVALNQIDAHRTRYFHQQVIDFLAERATPETAILELGGGVGFDLELFLKTGAPFGAYVFSEISLGMSQAVKAHVADARITYSTIDAHRIPFAAATFDVVYMIATLHHLPDLDAAFAEMARVLKPGGHIVCGGEPSKHFFQIFNASKGVAHRLMPQKEHSAADEEAEGFTPAGLEALAGWHGMRVARCQPIKLVNGMASYGLEFAYRALRLRRRIRPPRWMDQALITLDRGLLALPLVKRLSWDYTVIFHKPGGASG